MYYGIDKKKYKCIYSYEEVSNPEEWLDCPVCGLKPVVWLFDNGRSTACGCGENEYNHLSIKAESICSVYHRTNMTAEYDSDQLRKNWNHYVETGEQLFKRQYPDKW